MNIEILIGLFTCHFLADYTHLSTAEMLGAKRFGKPLFPIFKHALMHTILMLGFLGFANLGSEKLVLVSLFQLVTHFLIDTLKGRMNSWFPTLESPANKWHWIVFGFDQLLHSFVIIIMYCFIIK